MMTKNQLIGCAALSSAAHICRRHRCSQRTSSPEQHVISGSITANSEHQSSIPNRNRPGAMVSEDNVMIGPAPK